jgi:cytoskeletal protein RodZ
MEENQSVLAKPAAPKAEKAAPADAPKKKSNAGIIVAIIVAALILAGGAVAAVLIITNPFGWGKDDKETSQQEDKKDDEKKSDDKKDDDKKDDDKKDDDDDDDDTDDSDDAVISKPYTSNDAYYIKINGKKYNFNNTITEVEASGFKMHSQAKDQKVPAGGYLILIGGSRLTDGDSNGFGYTPYNDGKEKVTVAEAKLGSITLTTPSSDKAKDVIKKITVYGGIHIGSSLSDLKKVFGEATETKTASYGDTYEYKDSTYRKYSFKVKDGVVDEITWTNYGSLVK